MGNADRILASAEIIEKRAKNDRLSVVASAVEGVSNRLQDSIDACITGTPADKFVSELRKTHSDICRVLRSKLPGFDSDSVMQKLEPLFLENLFLLRESKKKVIPIMCGVQKPCSGTETAKIRLKRGY